MASVNRMGTSSRSAQITAFAGWFHNHPAICSLLALATLVGTGSALYWHYTDPVPDQIPGIRDGVRNLEKQNVDLYNELQIVEGKLTAAQPANAGPVKFTREQEARALHTAARALLGQYIFYAGNTISDQYCPTTEEIIENSLRYDVNYAPECFRLEGQSGVFERQGLPGPVVEAQDGMNSTYPGCFVGDEPSKECAQLPWVLPDVDISFITGEKKEINPWAPINTPTKHKMWVQFDHVDMTDIPLPKQ